MAEIPIGSVTGGQVVVQDANNDGVINEGEKIGVRDASGRVDFDPARVQGALRQLGVQNAYRGARIQPLAGVIQLYRNAEEAARRGDVWETERIIGDVRRYAENTRAPINLERLASIRLTALERRLTNLGRADLFYRHRHALEKLSGFFFDEKGDAAERATKASASQTQLLILNEVSSGERVEKILGLNAGSMMRTPSVSGDAALMRFLDESGVSRYLRSEADALAVGNRDAALEYRRIVIAKAATYFHLTEDQAAYDILPALRRVYSMK